MRVVQRLDDAARQDFPTRETNRPTVRQPVSRPTRQPAESEYHQELLRTLLELREDLRVRLAETKRLLEENRNLREQLQRQRSP